jgi:hypothetical protein
LAGKFEFFFVILARIGEYLIEFLAGCKDQLVVFGRII